MIILIIIKKRLFYQKDAERILQTIPTNEIFVVNDPELEIVFKFIFNP
jgi:hypothetical protein